MLEGRGLAFRYGRQDAWLFEGTDLCIETGEIVGLPGDSGCGKSTMAKILAGYLRSHKGNVLEQGAPLALSGFCPVQLIFQHPELAVNPRWKAGKIISEAHCPSDDLLERLAIDPVWLERYPHELSGGELQRICLARALGPGTRYLLCDEITSMLDPLTQALIWQMILDISRQRDLGILLISHDPALIAELCHRTLSIFEEII